MMDLSLTGSQIGSARSKGSTSNRSAKSGVPSARTRHNMLVNANGNSRRPASGKATKQSFMAMIDAGAKPVSKSNAASSSQLGNRNEMKYRSAGDLTLKSTPLRTSQARARSPPADSSRTESTLEPQPVGRGEEHLIDTALCLSSLQSLDRWLESSVALADNTDWQEIPLVDSQMSAFSDAGGYDELVSVSQRSPNPNFGKCPPKPPLDPSPRLQLNNSAAVAHRGPTASPGMVASIENLRSKEPVNLTRASLANKSDRQKREAVEVLVYRMNRAARVIQKWWRASQSRRVASRAAEAALRRMMEQKQRALSQELQQQQQSAPQQQQQKKSQEKARAERQRAISELHRRREEKAERQADLANSEVSRLKAEAKVGGSPRRQRAEPKVAALPRRPKVEENADDSPRRPKMAEKGHEKAKATKKAEDVRLEKEEDAVSAISAASKSSLLSGLSGSNVGPEGSDLNASVRSERTVTTIDDICKALKELEESESIKTGEETSKAEKKHSSKSAWAADIDRLLAEDPAPIPPSLTASHLRTHELAFLSDAPPVEPTKPLPADNLDQVSSDTRAAVEEVASQVALQRRALDDKAHEVVVLERALRQQEEQAVTNLAGVRAEFARQMGEKHEEYQSNLQRKHDLIEQLFEQKKELQVKCEAYVSEMRNMKEKFEKVLRQLQEKHDVEMRKAKEKHAAAEKLRMEKWEDRKTKEIREDTVKGVASELQVLMDQQKRTRAELVEKHKRELAGVRAELEAKLVSADDRAEKRYFERVQELREELTREKESACDREREMAKQRKKYESQLTNELQALETKRRQLYAEIEEERERQASFAANQRAELDQERARLAAARQQSSESLARDFESTRSEVERRHTAELREAKERLEAEKEAWLETQMRKQQAWSMAKERELRDSLKKERDRELERVVEELEQDRTAFREEIERTTENKVRRLREKLEAENVEFERSERVALEKYNKMKAEMLETAGENEKLKVLMRQKEEETLEIRKHYEKLNRERTKVSDVVREEFAEQLLTTGEENKALKMDLAEQRARHRLELEKERARAKSLEEEKEEELAAIHRRVKEAIRKKDDNLQELRMQHEAALKRAENFEQLLMQQREQLLSLKK